MSSILDSTKISRSVELKSKIRQQIKKILDKEKEYPRIARTVSALKPHIPHKYANEESEIEKLYGLPGEPI